MALVPGKIGPLSPPKKWEHWHWDILPGQGAAEDQVMCLRWCLGCSSGHWLQIIKLFIMTQARCPSCHTVSPMFCIIFSHLPPPSPKLVTENGASIIDQIQTKLECRAPGAKLGGWWVQRIMNIKLCDCRIAVIVLIIVDQGEYKWNMFCTPALSRKLILPHNLSDSKHWESEIWPTRYTLLYMPGKSWHCGAIFLLQLGQEQVVAWSNQHSPSDIIISGIIQ